ncbi:MAG: TRCF domain-containing protein [Candidatus Caldatribacteriaceae bacterium]
MRLNVDAYLPSFYIENETERLHYYHKIWEARDLKEIALLEEELQDRFGRFPKEVENLFKVTKLRYYAKITQVESVEEWNDGLYLEGPLEVLRTIAPLRKDAGRAKLVVRNGRVKLWFSPMPLSKLLAFFERMGQNE